MKPVKVVFRATGTLRERFSPGQEAVTVYLERPQPVKEILVEKLGINPEGLAAVVVAGRYRSRDYVPEDGDEIILISPVGGG
ncbi:MAG: hypothetical protein K6T29_09855 [Peptococcaceae bacterium]|nr:hypothetical protein [Peptococcaceae bacterium]